MDDTRGAARAVLVAGDVEFGGRDVTLFRTIARTGSVATAATELGRSRARALTRIETLEGAFGPLVERRRGGTAGGGSRVTERGVELLNRYDRLQAALAATVHVPETVLSGTVIEVTGELAAVNTSVGVVRGLHDDIGVGETTQVRIGADAITVHDPADTPDPRSMSARNHRFGRVSSFDRGSIVSTISVDVDGCRFRSLVTDASVTRLDLAAGRDVTLTWKATATHLVPSL